MHPKPIFQSMGCVLLLIVNFFSDYGKVMESRINKKSGNPNVPNFGFVVFDEERAVQAVLGQKGVRYYCELFSKDGPRTCTSETGCLRPYFRLHTPTKRI